MGQIARELMLLASLALASPSFAASTSETTTEVAANFLRNLLQSDRYQHLVCIYASGSEIHQCDLSPANGSYQVGGSCYCGPGLPKGRVKAVPLSAAPN
jgi:hypothetical protein